MIYKLRTSKETMDIFEMISGSEGLQPFILAKIALALSIRKGSLTSQDFKSDNNGLELNRQTIFGEYDSLFKSIITLIENEEISDNDFFPSLSKAHLDRGAKLLYNESRYGMNFYENLLKLDNNL